jgi:hypothetical protein
MSKRGRAAWIVALVVVVAAARPPVASAQWYLGEAFGGNHSSPATVFVRTGPDFSLAFHDVQFAAKPWTPRRYFVIRGGYAEPKHPHVGFEVEYIHYKALADVDRELIAIGQRLGENDNWIAGFGEGSRLVFDFEYDDGNQRVISDFSSEAKIKIRPSDGTLLVTMLVGVIIGTLVKFYLEYLHGKGLVSRKGVAAFVVITVVVGVVITVIAWGGQIQIIAFKTNGLSYDRPVAIFTMGLIGALSGVHTLNGFAKKYLPGTDGQGGAGQ